MTRRADVAAFAFALSLASLAMTLVGCGGGGSGQTTTTTTSHGGTPSEIVAKLDAQWQDAYNAGKFADVASFYNVAAQVIPLSGDQFLNKSQLENFFANNLSKTGILDVKLKPLTVFAESETLYHEIGLFEYHQHGAAGSQSTRYYARWINANSTWQMAFHSMSVGLKPPSSDVDTPQKSTAMVADPIGDKIASLEKQWQDSYTAGNYSDVVSLYHPGGLLIPPTGDKFLKQSELEDFFANMGKSGVKDMKLTTLTTLAERVRGKGSTVVHEIGTVSNSATPDGCHYYVRWIKNGQAWQMAVDITAVGMQKKAALDNTVIL
jgi:hypothetical protein